MDGDRGHRVLPHTAEVIVEAWGADRRACLEEAALGLVASFVDPTGAEANATVPLELDAGSDEDLLVGLLEEVIYVVDVHGAVPLAVRLDLPPGGGATGELRTAPAEAVELVGAVPKAISWHALEIGEDRGAGGWRCRVTVDV